MFLRKIKLYVKKILKKEISISRENIITWKSFTKIEERSFVGRNPPDEIIVIAKFSELNDLIPRMFRIIKIDIVKPELVEKKEPPIITSKIYIKCKLAWSTSREIPILEMLLTKDKKLYVKLVL